ncbi:MFS transporter [Achromobacter arsenitoxydans]|uniref:Major facilitator superfamily protein n=1 Tax=Achromobacter arsenitoxydans SY8 TaxID=477184 RepID=H0F864_9BURK|nr:MFS transporter [Achromobacter arsenitoxydans]EHK65497.1 major facilitator superfamily protein [Achromobacter arsenitoxydans SY8]
MPVASTVAAAAAPAEKAHGLITALGIGQICSWGSLYYSFPLIAEAMGQELGWSKPDLYGAATLGLVLAALAAYPVGVAVDRGYGRWVMGLSSLLAGALLMLWSQVTSLAAFYVLVAGIGALQAATLYEPAFAVVARRVGPSHSRAGITALTLWGGFASTVFIPLVQWLLSHWGWREALMVLAAVNTIICTGAYLLFIQPGRDARPVGTANPVEQRTRNRLAVQEALRRPVFWALLLSLTAYAAMFSAFTFHMYPLLRERGIDTAAVVQAIALIGPAQVVGRIVISLFAARASMRTVGTAVVSVFPMAFGALAYLHADFFVVATICVVYGGANGIFTIVRGMVVPEMLSRDAYGAINGLLTVPMTFARAAAPVGAAALWTIGSSYDGVLVAILVVAVLLAASFWLAAWLSRPKLQFLPE